MAKKQSLADRLRQKQADIKKGSGDYDYFIIKADSTTRVRILPFDEEEGDFSIEAITVYLGGDFGSIISPATFGEPCPFYDGWKELKASSDESDNALAQKVKPSKKYFIPVIRFEDVTGEKIDAKSPKLLQVTGGINGELIDYFLDAEQGDFSDEKNGYDVKIKRTGTTKQDTEYSLVPCKPTPLPKAFRGKVYNAETMLREIIKPYAELEVLFQKFTNTTSDEDAQEGEVRKKKKKVSAIGESTVIKKKKIIKKK